MFFYVTLKALLVFSRYLNFSPHFFGRVGKRSELKLIRKFTTSQAGKQITTIHTSPNISKKSRQADKEIWLINRMQHEKYFP